VGLSFFLRVAAYEMYLVRVVENANLANSSFGFLPIAAAAIPRALPHLPPAELCQHLFGFETTKPQGISSHRGVHSSSGSHQKRRSKQPPGIFYSTEVPANLLPVRPVPQPSNESHHSQKSGTERKVLVTEVELSAALGNL